MTDLAASYAGWRASTLAQITERLERDLVFNLAGPVAGRRVLDAVHYPRLGSFARLCAPLDPILGRLSAPGAAFLAISAGKNGSS